MVCASSGTPQGSDRAFRPHVFTLRSEHLWLGAGHARGHGALDLFGLFERYTGTLVSDDYNGCAKYQAILAPRQLRNAHLIRSAAGVVEAEPCRQSWATAMIEVLRAGRKAVKEATGAGRVALTSREIGRSGPPTRNRPGSGSPPTADSAPARAASTPPGSWHSASWTRPAWCCTT